MDFKAYVSRVWADMPSLKAAEEMSMFSAETMGDGVNVTCACSEVTRRCIADSRITWDFFRPRGFHPLAVP